MDPMTEEEELDAMIASYEEQRAAAVQQRPPSPTLSDDEWDNIFDELAWTESSKHGCQQTASDEMDLS
ncbi:hypothetical protein BGZ63DRAFT_384151 [Mariannaea sp. PMI_226]|nr:hypothetical protein BGZ63DRAFT_384151 [Mariannaea sp. PMI_226]